MTAEAPSLAALPKAPSLRLLLAESRVVPELSRYWRQSAQWQDLPRGEQPVLVVPGFCTSDLQTRPLRRALKALGHHVYGWGEGINTGINHDIRRSLARRVFQLRVKHGASVNLVGWSLGGAFVRELARQQPDYVGRVFTLGSPINITPNANNLLSLFKLMNRGRPIKVDQASFLRRCEPPPVPCTAIFSKSDGIVAWQTACEREAPNTENIEVQGSHFGMICNPAVVRVIAERLANA